MSQVDMFGAVFTIGIKMYTIINNVGYRDKHKSSHAMVALKTVNEG